MSYDASADIELNNHKLVIVMDHSPYFTTSSDPNKWLDSFCQDAVPVIPKSLWACMVESVMEFTRIVWNIFPKDKLIEIILSNHLAHILNNWEPNTQTTEYLAEAFGSIGQPLGETPLGQEASILHGLRGAMESLITYTPLQKVIFFDDISFMAKTQYVKLNRGRIICITSLSSDMDLKVLTDLFLVELSKYNYTALNSDLQKLPVTHCHLIIINVYPTDTTCDIVDQPPHQVSADLKLELHVIDAMHLSDKLAQLLVFQYNLVCTVINDIPSLSMTKYDHFYDAEMFHLRDVHLNMSDEYPEAIRDARIQGSFYTKMHLNWSKQQIELTDTITSMTRITPADVKSPGAIRLIKHLYSGKKILLEYQDQNSTIIKYMLAVQEGDIFLHTLMVPREISAEIADETKSSRDDSDTKTKSSETTDTYYSLDDTETAPDSDSTKFYESNTDTDDVNNAENFPIVCSENEADENILPFKKSILYSPFVKQMFFNVLSTFVRFRLTKNQIDMCCHIIEAMKSNQQNDYTLNLPRDNFYKSAPLQNQYQVLWDELQQFLEDNLYSSGHEVVYNYFREVVRGEASKFAAVYEPQTSTSRENEPSSSVEDPVEDTSRRLSLLDFLVRKTDKTQRNRKDKKRGKENKE